MSTLSRTLSFAAFSASQGLRASMLSTLGFSMLTEKPLPGLEWLVEVRSVKRSAPPPSKITSKE